MMCCFLSQVKLEIPEFDVSDDMTANLANEDLIALVEEVCTVWNRQIMDALDGLLKKTPEGKLQHHYLIYIYIYIYLITT